MSPFDDGEYEGRVYTQVLRKYCSSVFDGQEDNGDMVYGGYLNDEFFSKNYQLDSSLRVDAIEIELTVAAGGVNVAGRLVAYKGVESLSLDSQEIKRYLTNQGILEEVLAQIRR